MSHVSEKLESKIQRIPRSVSGNFGGLYGVFQTLMEEHGAMVALLLRVNSSSDESVYKDLYPTIRRELLAHETGECGTIYPVLSRYPDIADLVTSHAKEASELKSAITALDVLNYDDARWKFGFEYQVKLVRNHVEAEENDFFPRAQAAIGRQVAEMLELAYQESKSAIM